MELRYSSCKCNTDDKYVKSCCFNPVIFFICKLCRGTFENADKLILHKRQHHSLKDLKGIKLIVFEERFFETDDNMFRIELAATATDAGLRCKIENNNSSEISSVPPLNQNDSSADPETDDIINITDESEELPNPFVHLIRLTYKQINCYSRPRQKKIQDKNKVSPKKSSTKSQNISRVIQHKVIKTENLEDYTDCSLTLNDWIRKEKEANPENIILLDPDLFQAEAETNTEVETPAFVVTPQNPAKCKLCSKQLTSDLDAKRHLKFCWIENKTKHVHCPMCSKSYVCHKGLLSHKKIKHSKQPKRSISFKCTICEKELTTKRGLNIHMEVHKNPNLKPFICKICGSGLRNKYNLKCHKLSHSEDRPFKCELCPKVFKNKEVLRRHQVVHAKDNNYHCLPCNKSFKAKGFLRIRSIYHLKDKWLPCKAKNCNLKFPTKDSLWGHYKNDHKEMFLQMGKFCCTVCKKRFMFSGQLERHMMSHNGGEKRYKVPVTSLGTF